MIFGHDVQQVQEWLRDYLRDTGIKRVNPDFVNFVQWMYRQNGQRVSKKRIRDVIKHGFPPMPMDCTMTYVSSMAINLDSVVNAARGLRKG